MTSELLQSGASTTADPYLLPAPSAPSYDADGAVCSARDWLGHVFHVGDRVIYCIGAGRGQMMAIGTVMAMKATQRSTYAFRQAGDDEEPDHINPYQDPPTRWMKVPITYYDVRVLVKTHKTSGRWDNGPRERPAWVNPMNITALPLEGIQ